MTDQERQHFAARSKSHHLRHRRGKREARRTASREDLVTASREISGSDSRTPQRTHDPRSKVTVDLSYRSHREDERADIKLCVGYRLVNELTQLMVYPMPLVTDLWEDLNKYRWYCSLDMASGFWVVPMTAWVRLISAFVTPSGLFQWLSMSFGLCNSPQIYSNDNTLYGFWKLSPTRNTSDDFKHGIPSKPGTRFVLSRRSYIDDILIGGTSWDDLFKKVELFLEVCEEWHLSISVEKSEWGMARCRRRTRGEAEELRDPRDAGIPARVYSRYWVLPSFHPGLRDLRDRALLPHLTAPDFEERIANPETRDLEKWTHAERAFDTLRSKIETTLMLKHFDMDKQPVIIVYASDWAVSAVLAQDHDGVYLPVKLTSRMLKPNVLNSSIAEKEILALLRVLDECHNMLTGRTIRVLTRHTMLGWLFCSKGRQRRLSQWAAILSPWRLAILRSAKGEEEILCALAVSITPRVYVDSTLEEIAPRQRLSRTAPIPVPKIGLAESLHVICFDGSARVKRGEEHSVPSCGNYRPVTWFGLHRESRTVNEAEYRCMLLGVPLLHDLDVTRMVICGDSNLVNALREWPRHKFLHVRRDWNTSADMLAGQAPQHQGDNITYSAEGLEDLRTLNRLGEVVCLTTHDPERGNHASRAETHDPDVPVLEIETRDLDGVERGTRKTFPNPRERSEILKELEVQRLRLDRVCTAQKVGSWIANLMKFLDGDINVLSKREAKNCAKIAEQYEVVESGLPYYHVRGSEAAEKRDTIMKLVGPETLREDVLHHYQASLEGGHQGIGWTYQRVRQHFHRPGLFKSVQHHVGECVDCETGKGRPTIRGESPGNIVVTYPFQVVVDLFTGFVIAKASASRTAETVADSYEEAGFRRFGASEAIRHYREPGFMSDFFKVFNKLMGQREHATLAYRPQANGAAQRIVQTITRSTRCTLAIATNATGTNTQND
ncbi:LOW QUALITY PROTEIN: reverse transcriptase [Phytophthora megakarya]|uniref:Reverse transcriptase n=1 Tax=Phytophthora megakarya TaxID=4795 RepID=A0A225WUL0_9STRA|nr:LOW QUALITY PROTEIN: reverse transcriptase [Phytophthora megakarya]